MQKYLEEIEEFDAALVDLSKLMSSNIEQLSRCNNLISRNRSCIKFVKGMVKSYNKSEIEGLSDSAFDEFKDPLENIVTTFNKDLKRYHQIEHFDTTLLCC